MVLVSAEGTEHFRAAEGSLRIESVDRHVDNRVLPETSSSDHDEIAAGGAAVRGVPPRACHPRRIANEISA